jgi:hypothetical protein
MIIDFYIDETINHIVRLDCNNIEEGIKIIEDLIDNDFDRLRSMIIKSESTGFDDIIDCEPVRDYLMLRQK